MILGGLAIGVGLQEYGYDPSGGIVVLGLGAGFIAIYLVNVLVQSPASWWPLIPGGILSVVGVTQLAEGTAAAETVARLWPVGLIVAGVIVLLATFMRPDQSRTQTPCRPSSRPRGTRASDPPGTYLLDAIALGVVGSLLGRNAQYDRWRVPPVS